MFSQLDVIVGDVAVAKVSDDGIPELLCVGVHEDVLEASSLGGSLEVCLGQAFLPLIDCGDGRQDVSGFRDTAVVDPAR